MSVVAVEDQGHGIPEDDLPRVFDLFWQGEDAYARRHGGIGLPVFHRLDGVPHRRFAAPAA